MLSPSSNLFGTGNDLPANFGNIVIPGWNQDGSSGLFTPSYWGYDSSDETVIVGYLFSGNLRMVKITLTGNTVASSAVYKATTSVSSLTELIDYYTNYDGTSTYTFTKGTNFYGITFGDDDTLSWYSSLDLNTTNFWEYMNTYFVDTGIFALTGTNSIRWEGGTNGTVRPDITINLEGGYVLNINTLWFVTDYTKGLYHRIDTGTGGSIWWIEDLSPGGLYQFQLYSYNSSGDQQFNASFDVVGLTTQSYTFFMGTTTSPVVTDTIEADANGKIFINTMDNGPHGSSLAWIRIRAVGSEPPLHIEFSAYTNQTIEFAQADLTSKFSSVSPQFLVGATKDQATSSNSNFEDQKTAYIPGPGQINFWHYSGDNTPATFKCISDRDGKCIIVYGCLWTNESVKVYVNGSLHSETTFTSDTTTISVSTGDVIEITESQSVMGLHSITFLRQLSEPVNRYVWSNDAGESVPTNNRINLISYGELNNNFNFSGKFTIRFTWETNSYSNNSTVYEMINGTDTSGEYGGLTGYRDTSNYGIIFRVFQRYGDIVFDTWPSIPRSMNYWTTSQSDIVGKHEYKIEYDGNQETCKLFIDGNEKTKNNPSNVVYFTSLPFYSADSDLYITAGGSFFDGGSTSSANKIYYYEYLEDIE